MRGTSPLQLRVLGCCGSYAGPDGACSGYLLSGGGVDVWLDAGPGTLAQLQKHIELNDLSALVLTHEHPDHWLELPVLRNALQYYQKRFGFPVISNEAVRARAEALIGRDELELVFEWTVVTPDSVHMIGDQRWTFSETDHYVPTLATRTEVDGHSIAFSADTGPGWALSELGTVDLAVVEATYSTRIGHEAVLHLSAAEAARMAHDAGASELVLTHQAPGEDPLEHLAAAKAEFDGPISVASIGAVYTA